MTTLQQEVDREQQWKSMYRFGAISTLIVLAGIAIDIIIGSLTGGDLSALPQTAVGRYEQLQRNWLLGLYNLDLLNIIIQLFMIPSYFALYAAHRETNRAYAGLALVIFLVGTTILVVSNSALTMLDLSDKYAASQADAQKLLLAAAGEAMLAKGMHGALGVFIGFLLPNIAGLMMSCVMLKGKIFSRSNAILGAVGSILIGFYVILVTFLPGVKTMATIFAAPAGLLLLAWMIMFTRRLFQLSLVHESGR